MGIFLTVVKRILKNAVRLYDDPQANRILFEAFDEDIVAIKIAESDKQIYVVLNASDEEALLRLLNLLDVINERDVDFLSKLIKNEHIKEETIINISAKLQSVKQNLQKVCYVLVYYNCSHI